MKFFGGWLLFSRSAVTHVVAGFRRLNTTTKGRRFRFSLAAMLSGEAGTGGSRKTSHVDLKLPVRTGRLGPFEERERAAPQLHTRLSGDVPNSTTPILDALAIGGSPDVQLVDLNKVCNGTYLTTGSTPFPWTV